MVTTVIPLSGGLDSVYTTWKWLEKNKKDTLLIYHVSLRNPDGRWAYEDEAVRKFLLWLNAQGFTNYEYVEHTLGIEQSTPRMWDSSILAFMTAALLTNPKYKGVKTIVSNTPRDEYLRLGANLQTRVQKSAKIRQATNAKSYNVVKPLETKFKKEIIEELPKELLELAWYCRKPTSDGGTCHTCHTCKQVDKAMEDIEKDLQK